MEIKPCPFCGSKEILIERGLLDENGKKSEVALALTIHCINCHAMFRRRGKDAYKVLIERWNRRVRTRP